MNYEAYAILFVLIYIVTIYIIISRYRNERNNIQNIIDDVPNVYVNKEALEKHAVELANYHSDTRKVGFKRKLMKSLSKNFDTIRRGYKYIDRDLKNKREIIPAAEWMLDNLYLIEKEYKDIRTNMPEDYYRDLPVLDRGIMKGYPRIYHIALEVVAHTDGRVNEEIIDTFLVAYQRNITLTTGELWALPIMLRIALIQNIGKIVEKIVFAQEEKKRGEKVAEDILSAIETNNLDAELRNLTDGRMRFTSHFTERLFKTLRDNAVDSNDVYKWLDERLEAQQTNTEKMINIEHQKQAGFRLSIGNCVTGLREVSALNWRNVFERLSYVEQILRSDPANIYGAMDFESRDYYRHSIEKLAKSTGAAESYISKKAIECAAEAAEYLRTASRKDGEYIGHVGYYLVDDGVEILKDKIAYRDRGLKAVAALLKKHRVFFYIGIIIVGTLLLDLVITSLGIKTDTSWWKYAIAAIALLIPCSEIIISLLNWSINHITSPRFVPKLEFRDELPEEHSAVVIIPTLLNNESRVHDLIADMEVYYLANQDKNIYFALLGDFKDSKVETEEKDEKIIEAALADIKALNEKYGQKGQEIFYFFNRYRQYNHKQGICLGWERKRGKIMEFNALLRGAKDTSYDVISADITNLAKVKYVITLDADTQLPRDSARKMIGAMAHPLNEPYLDNKRKRVVRGYGLLQPRISVSSISANKTLFSKIFSGETGIDIYTMAISDVYQDVFGEGIFTGKGIYNIDVFEHMLNGEIPENSVLSHDLLEGSYVRAGLVTDIELVDGYPAFYNASSKRLHRWVRGDWQLLPWLFKKSPLNTLSRWKICDNLRRSLLAPVIILLVVLAFSLLPGTGRWLAVAFAAVVFPLFFDVSETMVSPIKGISLSGRMDSTRMIALQVFLIFCFLPYQTCLMLDAIVRTLYRVYVSRKDLLEWQTAADVEAGSGRNLQSYLRGMWCGSAIALVIALLAFAESAVIGTLMLPVCAVWFISPAIAYYISRERKMAETALDENQEVILRRISRKTWAYFEDFVSMEDNWLAPDNYQEEPHNGIAHRTSPTNIGMGLASNIVAFDLGYIGILEVADRLEKILDSMDKLVKFKGHFYNWYNTKTMEPLYPRYISTVDSGNLVGYLWVIAQALFEYAKAPVINQARKLGLIDTLLLVNEEIEKVHHSKDYYAAEIAHLRNQSFDIVKWKHILDKLVAKTEEAESFQSNTKFFWSHKLKNALHNALDEIHSLFPWIDILQGSGIEQALAWKLASLPFGVALERLGDEYDSIMSNPASSELNSLMSKSGRELGKLLQRIELLVERLNRIVGETDFSVVYDSKRELFAIGYDLEKESIGNSHYDLLASECRQASFIAIAKGDVQQKHWFKLGRSMTTMGRSKGLVSWSGTMFEYFMPLLVMKNYPSTLLNETYDAVIEGQKSYCKGRGVPWGISESAFYRFDVNLNYQYKAFGIPGIGLKRGLANELVISPYSTVMGLQIDLPASISNLQRLIVEGLEGRYGFYDAIDYTRDRMPKGKKKVAVKCYMVHHAGMSFMALDNVLNSNIFQERFHRVPMVKATELLLQEKVPRTVIYEQEQKIEVAEAVTQKQTIVVRSYTTAKTPMPETHLMSNGSYALMISNSGSGYSKKDDMMVYRWREDVTCDCSGMFFYIKNLNSNEYWSAAYEPCKDEGEDYEVVFALDKVEFKRRDGNIVTHTEIAVSNHDDAEVRMLSITNHSEHTRTVEITSYCEVTLAPLNADIVHPSFSNLFIQTEYLDNPSCIIANRRPRAKGQKRPWMMQTVAMSGDAVGSVQYETSRANFIGRGRNITNPLVLDSDTPLQNTVGAVLDPIISIRRRIKIEPGQACKIAYTTAVADSREEILMLATKYSEMQNVERVFELSTMQTQMEIKYMGLKSAQANLYQLMSSRVLFLNTLLQHRDDYIKNIKGYQSNLWRYGISGDLPIVMVMLRNEKGTDLVRQMLTAHEYWSMKGLKSDLVILNQQSTMYTQPLQDSLNDLISSSPSRERINKAGGVFLHSEATMNQADIALLIGIARIVIDADNGVLTKQIKNNETQSEIELLKTCEVDYPNQNNRYDVGNLLYFNELGGFEAESGSYVIVLKGDNTTPAPWINVISNANFGFHISESGISYTWYRNSRENKVTPWSNDPVTDTITEGLYLRDEITGKVWGITPKPVRDDGEYMAEHGFGFSTFKHSAYGIEGEMTVFVPTDESTKLCIVRLKNNTEHYRELSLTYYAQLVLGVVPQQTGQYTSTYLNEDEKYIYARNPYNEHFGNQHVFLKIYGGESESFTGDRKEFIGRGRCTNSPEALKRKQLSNIVGAGFDPCLAENAKVSLQAGREKVCVIAFGAAESMEEMQKILRQYEESDVAFAKFAEVKEYWRKLLGTIQVKTPDKSMDLMLNGWLIYQTISCRIWSRTAFYQSGGAYGFRDQLQDVMAAAYLDPEFAVEQIMRSAERQFVEGDVQHWWHPVVNSGIRTRFSDDYLWLPYVVLDYIKNTGDYSILDREAGYLEDEPLKEGEDERYKISQMSDKKASIYEHCVNAVDYGLKYGAHNIPLMGSGDWNDGMSTVGNEGRGESVWLGWFIYKILEGFEGVCKKRGDIDKANYYEEQKESIRENLEREAWDGSWYRRAYFDDGTPLGSAENDECQIDSLAQSWAVISGAAKDSRAVEAMDALDKYLIKREHGMILLFTPAFNNSKLEPGYIKGYVPGVRENGAQYTHAAVWVILALAQMGQCSKAWHMFNMINPINHAKSFLGAQRYKVEPYVMVADIYAREPHIGRGGWSWYTGAAGWMYRTGVEAILGLKFKEDKGFVIDPCIPDEWDGYEIVYNRENCMYIIDVKKDSNKGIWLDGQQLDGYLIPFMNEGEHQVEVRI